MGFTQALESEVLDALLSRASLTSNATTLYAALSTTTPTNTGSNFTEPTDASYARVAITNNATNWPAASAGAKVNGTDITFPTAAAAWGTCTYFGLFTAATGGVPIMTGALTASKSPASGDTLKFLAGDFHVTLS